MVSDNMRSGAGRIEIEGSQQIPLARPLPSSQKGSIDGPLQKKLGRTSGALKVVRTSKLQMVFVESAPRGSEKSSFTLRSAQTKIDPPQARRMGGDPVPPTASRCCDCTLGALVCNYSLSGEYLGPAPSCSLLVGSGYYFGELEEGHANTEGARLHSVHTAHTFHGKIRKTQRPCDDSGASMNKSTPKHGQEPHT